LDIHNYSIEEEISFEKLLETNQVIGFCYPIYGSRVPRIMREFVLKYRSFIKNKSREKNEIGL